jgi:DNA-binding MarR family transcriptional regulator
MAIKAPDRHVLEGMDLGLLGESVGSAVRLLRNLLTSRVVAAFEPYGLRTGTFSTMALIAANPGCSQSDIARLIGTDKSIVVAIVDHLESAGLAMRQRSRQDRRRNALTLTAKGEALIEEMRQLGYMAEQPIRDALSPEDVAQLIALTRRAVDALMAAEPG